MKWLRELDRVGGPSGDCSLSSWGHQMHFVARTRGEAPGRSLIGLFFFKRCIISPLEGRLRRSGGRRSSTPGRRDSVLSLACTLLAAGRRAQGAGREGKTFAERVDEVCLHLTAGRFDQEAGGGVEGGEGGEGVVGLSTLLFLLCHGRRSSRRRSGDFLLSGPFAFSCQAEDNVRVWAELEVDGFVQGAHGC